MLGLIVLKISFFAQISISISNNQLPLIAEKFRLLFYPCLSFHHIVIKCFFLEINKQATCFEPIVETVSCATKLKAI
jgi:hypothetical protein